MLYANARRSSGAWVLIAAVITGFIEATPQTEMSRPVKANMGSSEASNNARPTTNVSAPTSNAFRCPIASATKPETKVSKETRVPQVPKITPDASSLKYRSSCR